MGNALQEQGKLEEAIKAYTKAISIAPDFAEAYFNIGITHNDQGKLDDAVLLFKKYCQSSLMMLRPTTTWAMHSKTKESWKRQ